MSENEPEKPKKNQQAKKLLLFAIRWGIAIVGVWLVVSNMTLHDSVLLLNPTTNLVTATTLTQHADEDAREFKVFDPATKQEITVGRDRLINPPTLKTVTISDGKTSQTVDLLGMRLEGDINSNPAVTELLIKSKDSQQGRWIDPSLTVPKFELKAPRPRVTVGIINMVKHANPWLLILSVIVFPITFIITSYRWNKLLQAVEIRMGLARAFVINMVGAFYNTFMPGSTGGDVLKAWYASKQTPHRMRAVMSVVIDRVLGLLALVMVGGIMATYQYLTDPHLSNPTSKACFQVAIACVLILAGVGVGLAILFQPSIRTMLGVEFILNKLPMQKHINSAREVLRLYRARPGLALWALLITIPVHLTVIISAALAGQAFGLPIQTLFYFTAVPVIVLVGSIPISPQGAGVMEAFAILLTRRQGTTVNDAVALTMSIRLVQIFWNLTGGIFVLRGGYHAPSESEQKEMGEDEETRGQGDKETRGDAV